MRISQIAMRQRPDGLPIMHMRWEALLFLHWKWEVADLQARMPAGLTIDTYEGEAWLGVVPLFMRRVRPVGLPPMPWVSDFLELNVRTYVVDEKGRPGVWFFSLSANQPLAVEVARRTFGLNYVHARMATRENGNLLNYECSRRDGDKTSVIEYEPVSAGEPAVEGSLEFFLLERYLLFAAKPGGKLVSGQVHHRPYLARRTQVTQWDFHAAAADGLQNPGRAPDHVVATAPVDVDAWPPEVVS